MKQWGTCVKRTTKNTKIAAAADGERYLQPLGG
jgi:hypothetical protein